MKTLKHENKIAKKQKNKRIISSFIMNKKKLSHVHCLKQLRKQEGFTLVEMVIYVGAAIFVFGSITGLVFILISSKAKNQAVAEVEQQGTFVLNNISQTIRNAENINSPLQAASDSTLELDVVEAGDDPTIYNLLDGAIQVTEGAASAVNLTSDRVIASNLTFQNLSRDGTPGVIRINFTLSASSSDRGAYRYEKTFYVTASLR